MFFYAMFVLGRSNRVEYRMYLAAAGLMSVLLGLLMSLGILMALGVKFNTLLGVLPFLAMGMYYHVTRAHKKDVHKGCFSFVLAMSLG